MDLPIIDIHGHLNGVALSFIWPNGDRELLSQFTTLTAAIRARQQALEAGEFLKARTEP